MASNTNYHALTIRSPMQFGGEVKDQDRAQWFEAVNVAAVADGVTFSPRSADGAEIIVTCAPMLFGADVAGRLHALADLLVAHRLEAQQSPIRPSAETPESIRDLVVKAARERMAEAYQTTLAALSITPTESGIQSIGVWCGDTVVLVFSPTGELLINSLRAGTCQNRLQPQRSRFGPGDELLVKVFGTAAERPLLAKAAGIQPRHAKGWILCSVLDCRSRRAPSRSNACRRRRAVHLTREDLLFVPRYWLAPDSSSTQASPYRRLRYSTVIRAVPAVGSAATPRAATTTSRSSGLIQDNLRDRSMVMMTTDELSQWQRSRKYACVHGVRQKPIPHPQLPDSPVVLQCGQAVVLPTVADDGGRFVLKRFLQGRCPGEDHLKAVANVLPRSMAFISGTDRHVLTGADLRKQHGCYHSPDLERWLDGAIQMPRATGIAWAGLADDVRDRTTTLDVPTRLSLCRSLSQLVALLESKQCAHRDLSSGNVFIEPNTWQVNLIDFDSLYHPSISMPETTTLGSDGYMPSFAWQGGKACVDATWHPNADRVAHTLLNVEFLVMDRHSPLSGDGGLFDQDELHNRKGPSIDGAKTALRRAFPGAVDLLGSAVEAEGYDDCPTHAWSSSVRRPASQVSVTWPGRMSTLAPSCGR